LVFPRPGGDYVAPGKKAISAFWGWLAWSKWQSLIRQSRSDAPFCDAAAYFRLAHPLLNLRLLSHLHPQSLKIVLDRYFGRILIEVARPTIGHEDSVGRSICEVHISATGDTKRHMLNRPPQALHAPQAYTTGPTGLPQA
jgi:hypothetical protein